MRLEHSGTDREVIEQAVDQGVKAAQEFRDTRVPGVSNNADDAWNIQVRQDA